jgi:hypothetical protein
MLSVHLHHTICCASWYHTSCLQEAKFYCKYDSLHGHNLHNKESIKEEINNIYLCKYKLIGQHYYSCKFSHKEELKHTHKYWLHMLGNKEQHGECNFNLLFNDAVST